MMSKEQVKRGGDKPSLQTIGSLLLAVAIVFFWLRSIGDGFRNTANPKTSMFLIPTSQDLGIDEKNISFGPTQQIISMGTPTPTPTNEPLEVVVKVEYPATPVPTKEQIIIKDDFWDDWLDKIRVPGYMDLGYYPQPDYLYQDIQVRLSYYWPSLCITEKDPAYQINCWHDPITGLPEPRFLSSGQDWVKEQLAGKILACPLEIPMGTKIMIDNKIFVCKDTGEKIIYQDGYYWLDLLYPESLPGHYWGEIITAKMVVN